MSGSIRACMISKYLKEKMDFTIISSKTKHWVYDETLLEEVKDLKVIRIPDPIGLLFGGKIKEERNSKIFIDSKFLWRFFSEIYIKENFKNVDLIYVSSPPPSTIILGYKLKKFLNSKLIIELRDEWLSKNKRMDEKLMEILRKCDGIVYSYESLKEKFKLNGIVAEHGHEENFYKKKENKNFVIFYTGTLKNSLNSFIKFVSILKNLKDVEIHYAGILPENLPVDIKKTIKFHGFLPYKKLRNYLKESDLFLISFDKIGEYTIPSRFFEYLGYEIPILCIGPKGIYLEKILKERNKGFYIGIEEIENSLNIIENLKREKIKVKLNGITWKECAEIIYEYIKGI